MPRVHHGVPAQAGRLAAQQADVIAEVIAAEAGCEIVPTPFSPVLRGLLMTGGAPALPSLRAAATVARGDGGDRGNEITPGSGGASSAAGQALWWPPAKIAGRYLAPYLATARPSPLAAEPLVDRVADTRSGAQRV